MRFRGWGVPTAVVDHRTIKPREAHDRAVLEVLRSHRVDIVCLAGYMRFLTPDARPFACWNVSCTRHPRG